MNEFWIGTIYFGIWLILTFLMFVFHDWNDPNDNSLEMIPLICPALWPLMLVIAVVTAPLFCAMFLGCVARKFIYSKYIKD